MEIIGPKFKAGELFIPAVQWNWQSVSLHPNQDKPVGANWASLSATTEQGGDPDLSGNQKQFATKSQ